MDKVQKPSTSQKHHVGQYDGLTELIEVRTVTGWANLPDAQTGGPLGNDKDVYGCWVSTFQRNKMSPCTTEGSEIKSRQGKIFVLSTPSRPAVGTTQPLSTRLQLVPRTRIRGSIHLLLHTPLHLLLLIQDLDREGHDYILQLHVRVRGTQFRNYGFAH
jgi:hypothetical protein